MSKQPTITDCGLRVQAKAVDMGANLVGFTVLERLMELETSPPELLDGYRSAVSIAVRIPSAVFDTVSDRPTPEYKSAYQTANRLLDLVAFKIAGFLEDLGFRSLPVPASQVLDKQNWTGALCHRAVAYASGLGWIGRNNLLVTPQFGPRVRLVTVLTAAELGQGAVVENGCGDCMACCDACPVEALKGALPHPGGDREDVMWFSRCARKLNNEFSGLPGVGMAICGICIRACPVGKG